MDHGRAGEGEAMNKRAGKAGATRPTPQEVAQFDALSLHELGRLLAAGRIAYQRKEAAAKRLTRKP